MSVELTMSPVVIHTPDGNENPNAAPATTTIATAVQPVFEAHGLYASTTSHYSLAKQGRLMVVDHGTNLHLKAFLPPMIDENSSLAQKIKDINTTSDEEGLYHLSKISFSLQLPIFPLT